MVEPFNLYDMENTDKEEANTPLESRVFKPTVPFPNALKKPKKEKEQAKLKVLVSQVIMRMPFVDTCMIIRYLKKYMKGILNGNISLEEGVMLITQECSTQCGEQGVQKLEDPDSFVLSCEIKGATFGRCLCDLGSRVNLMPYTVAKLLGINSFEPTKIHLVFTYRLVRRPVGIVVDLQIIIGGCSVPTDFIVLELDQEPCDPIILGRPSLVTVEAMLNVRGGKIKFELGDLTLDFKIDKTLQKPTIDGRVFSVD